LPKAAALTILARSPSLPHPQELAGERQTSRRRTASVLVYRIMPSGDPACASYDSRNCLWGQDLKHVRLNDVHPLICGANHHAQWGVTGYENPKHWCNLAKRVATL
jgi:hypothetical protein